MGGKQDVRIKGKLRAYRLQWPSFYRGGGLCTTIWDVVFPWLGNMLSIWIPFQGCVDMGSGYLIFPSAGSC